jgi:ribonuclease HI
MRKDNPNDNQWLTIYTDAGFGNGIGTYGIWIRIQPGRRTFEGQLAEVSNNNEAEMQAVVLGLEFGLKFWAEHYLQPPRGITIATDSQHARTRFSKAELPFLASSGRPIAYTERAIHAKFFQIKPENTPIKFKSLKGHGNKKSVSSWLNNWCDKAATKARTGL